MRIAIVLFVAVFAAGGVCAKGGGGGGHSSKSSGGTHSVRGHVTKKGTYVAPHRATNPDKSKANNWSSKGNRNPDTGKEGTKDPNR